MAVSIDLKPLNEETIQQMGYSSHDLWLVKIDSIVFGPFETESLKHYVGDNEHLFEHAEASLADESNWKPFWESTGFQQKKLQAVSSENYEGPFWIMDMGLKTGPFSYREIDKKIEMGLLVMTDNLSVDNGENWIKIYQVKGLDRRSFSPDELPNSPYESSFEKAQLKILSKLEQSNREAIEGLASAAFEILKKAKPNPLKIEEMTLKTDISPEISPSLNIIFPAIAISLILLASATYVMFSISDEDKALADLPETQTKSIIKKSSEVTHSGSIPTGGQRSPANFEYNEPRPSFPSEPRYPTQVETHEDHQNDPEIDRGPAEAPAEPDQPQEHSLVGNESGDQSLDAAMNNGNPAPVEQPIIEEASDF
jgi:hypothetical protein